MVKKYSWKVKEHTKRLDATQKKRMLKQVARIETLMK